MQAILSDQRLVVFNFEVKHKTQGEHRTCCFVTVGPTDGLALPGLPAGPAPNGRPAAPGYTGKDSPCPCRRSSAATV
jgi:hypothetical protein